MIDIEQFLVSLRTHKNADGKLNPIYLADTIQKEIEIIQEAIKHSQRWVGLTDEELIKLSESGLYLWELWKAIENKLKDSQRLGQIPD